jgi:hypothetical protein
VLGEEEAKTAVDLTLTPGGSIAGRVVDEEGSPVTGCNVSAMDTDTVRGSRRLMARGGGNIDDRGEYRLTNLPKGKYYVMVRCFGTIPLPHAFIRRGPETEIPTLAYQPQLYPGVLDAASAMKVSVSPGTEASGIDFKLVPAAGVTIRGRVGLGDEESLRRPVQISLVPKDTAARDLLMKNAMFNRQTGSFRMEHVMPGSYDLVAISRGGGGPEEGSYMARMPMEIGTTDPPPVELRLEPSASVKGVLVLEGADDKSVTVERTRIMLQPRDNEMYAPPAQGQVQKDGTFVLQNVTPGKFNVVLSGVPGFVKSVAVGDRDMPDELIDFTNGVAGPLRITISAKWAQISGTIPGIPTDAGPVTGLMWPVDSDNLLGRGNRTFGVQSAGGQFMQSNITPGKYYACAVAVTDGWSLMRNQGLMEALKSRCTNVELKEGETANVQVAYIGAGDLQRLLEESDR